jgi:hypothetical protein
MSQDAPSPPSLDAPSAAITNNKVALALFVPPSPASPALPRRAGAMNLFRDGTKKHHSDLPSTGYLPAKKKGRRHTCGAGISPCNAEAFVNDASDGNNDKDKDHSPTPTYKIVRTARPKKRDANVTLDSNYFSFLCPSTFDMKRFTRGHPQVYLDEEVLQFDASF